MHACLADPRQLLAHEQNALLAMQSLFLEDKHVQIWRALLAMKPHNPTLKDAMAALYTLVQVCTFLPSASASSSDGLESLRSIARIHAAGARVLGGAVLHDPRDPALHAPGLLLPLMLALPPFMQTLMRCLHLWGL
eukprot:2061191-Rhodomonas_salina.2